MTDRQKSKSNPGPELHLWLDKLKDLKGRSFEAGDLSRPGLIVLDLMNLFCRQDSPAFLTAFPNISENIFRLVRIMTLWNRPVVFTRHVHDIKDSGGLIKRFFGRLQRRDDPLSQLIPAVSDFVPPARIIDKQRHSALLEPLIRTIFKSCNSLIITGVQTHLCILSTAIDCARCSLIPIVTIDATTSKNSRLHLGTLQVLASGHSFAWTVEEIERRIKTEGKVRH